MLTQFSRTELLLGKEAMDKLKNSRVAVFGIGGVGGYVCEALVRSGKERHRSINGNDILAVHHNILCIFVSKFKKIMDHLRFIRLQDTLLMSFIYH